MWANFRLPVLLLANVRTLFLTSFFTSFFASFVFISFLGLIVKQIFEERENLFSFFFKYPRGVLEGTLLSRT